MVILRRTCSTLYYCPFLPIVCSLLLIYLDKGDTLKILRIMLNDSEKMLNEEGQFNRAEELRGLRWYFPLDKKDYHSIIETFMTFMVERSKSVKECLSHLESIKVDTRKFMQEQFSSFFLQFVPLDIINTMFSVYINEGIKIMFRIGYAFFKTLKEEILECNTEDEFKFNTRERLEMLDDDEKRRFINQCYHLRIVRIKKQFSLIDTLKEDLNKSYICDPNVIGDSEIIKDEKEKLIIELFKELPPVQRTYDIKLIFSTKQDGHSISNMIKLASAYKDESAVFFLFVEDKKGNVFGAYLQHELGKTGPKRRLGSAENFVFTLHPSINFYHSQTDVGSFFEFDGSTMYIGAGDDGCAIVIDDGLNEGYSGASNVFGNDPLTQSNNKDFSIKYLELMIFV